MAIGEHGRFEEKEVEHFMSTPMEDIQALETELAKNFNEGNYSAIANAYNPGALLIPPAGDSFFP